MGDTGARSKHSNEPNRTIIGELNTGMIVGAAHQGSASPCEWMLNLAFATSIEFRGTLANSVIVDSRANIGHFSMHIGFEHIVWEGLEVVSCKYRVRAEYVH